MARGPVGVVLGMLVAAACGLAQSPSYADSHTGAQIVSDASAAMSKAGSYHMKLKGNFTNGIASADIDVEGISYRGTIGAAGQSVRIIVVNGDTFVYGSDFAAVLDATNSQAAAVIRSKANDRWLHLPAGSGGPALTDIIDLNSIGSCLKEAAGLIKKGATSVDGKAVVEVDDLAGSKLDIATSSPHYPIRLDFTSAEACMGSDVQNETLDFSQFGTAYHIQAPPGFIDLTTLLGG